MCGADVADHENNPAKKSRPAAPTDTVQPVIPMTWTKVCPLVCAALIACASEETEYLGPSAPNAAGNASGGSASGGSANGGRSTGGSNAGGNATGAAGSANAGSSGTAGNPGTGGTFSNGGNASAGTFSNGGTSNAGAGGTSSGAAGKGGNGGVAGSGGKGGGGVGGMGGNGGTPPTQCTGVVVPPKSEWQGSALRFTENDPPSRVFDGNDTTRFATGAPQMGDEWLQIDFGEAVTLNEIRLHTNNNDYFRHYQLRLSNTPQDFTAAVLTEADGTTGTITVPIAPAKAGRYLTIRQTGTVTPTWWSLHEVTVACK
jgi:hypothetical protein